MESQELRETVSVGFIFDDAETDRPSEFIPEDGVVAGDFLLLCTFSQLFIFIRELLQHLQGLSDKLLLDGLQTGMLLNRLPADVQRQ